MTKCGYCGEEKEKHEKSHISTKCRNVKIRSGAISALKSTVTFYGDCYDKAKEDDNWEL